MSLDHRLIELLVCPLCKGPLQMGRDDHNQPVELRCMADRLGFPIRDGIPVMLEGEARSLADDPNFPSPMQVLRPAADGEASAGGGEGGGSAAAASPPAGL
jgi:hypothetical protein